LPDVSLDDGQMQDVEIVVVDDVIVDVALRRDSFNGLMTAHVYGRV